MKRPIDLSALLMRKAGNDLAAARIGLAHGAPLDTVCFHVQQGAEKMLKAALAAKDLDYPFTHELHDLLELAVPHYPALVEFADTIPEYTEFAVRLRYDDIPWMTREEVENALKEVERLREFLLPLAGRPSSSQQ
jgi:HEPN domain-containing protein